MPVKKQSAPVIRQHYQILPAAVQTIHFKYFSFAFIRFTNQKTVQLLFTLKEMANENDWFRHRGENYYRLYSILLFHGKLRRNIFPGNGCIRNKKQPTSLQNSDG